MKMLVALSCFLLAANGTGGPGSGKAQLLEEGTEAPASRTGVHHLREAHEVTVGSGVRVGILDHSFETDAHPGLYAGHAVFGEDTQGTTSEMRTQRGFWMALTLRDIAPDASIYALEVPTSPRADRVGAILQALEWAADNDLDVITYCGDDLSESDRNRLDPAVERAVERGITVVFTDYPSSHNLLPGAFGPSVPQSQRDPDLNIFSDDCTSLLAGRFTAFVEADDDQLLDQRPFLARPATGPITAGLVALVKSVDPDATPEEVKEILKETSRPMLYQGRRADRVPDAYRAVKRAINSGT